MKTEIEVIGVYPFPGSEPVHLIEILVRNSKGPFDLIDFTQELQDTLEDNWQSPWEEKLLDAGGENIIADGYIPQNKPELWEGNVRMAFFFHYLDLSLPLRTPWGKKTLPAETPLPARLQMIEYLELD